MGTGGTQGHRQGESVPHVRKWTGQDSRQDPPPQSQPRLGWPGEERWGGSLQGKAGGQAWTEHTGQGEWPALSGWVVSWVLGLRLGWGQCCWGSWAGHPWLHTRDSGLSQPEAPGACSVLTPQGSESTGATGSRAWTLSWPLLGGPIQGPLHGSSGGGFSLQMPPRGPTVSH